MAGVIEGFRSVLLKTNPIPWDLILVGYIVALIVFISGCVHADQIDNGEKKVMHSVDVITRYGIIPLEQNVSYS